MALQFLRRHRIDHTVQLPLREFALKLQRRVVQAHQLRRLGQRIVLVVDQLEIEHRKAA